jgi:hypothetical protein
MRHIRLKWLCEIVLRSDGCRFVAKLGTVMQFVYTNHQNIYGIWRHSGGMACV